jgi:hypothetical protein
MPRPSSQEQKTGHGVSMRLGHAMPVYAWARREGR